MHLSRIVYCQPVTGGYLVYHRTYTVGKHRTKDRRNAYTSTIHIATPEPIILSGSCAYTHCADGR